MSFSTNEKQKPKQIAPCRCDFYRTLNKLEIIACNFDWLIALFAPVVIGRSNDCGIVFFDSHLKTALLSKDKRLNLTACFYYP